MNATTTAASSSVKKAIPYPIGTTIKMRPLSPVHTAGINENGILLRTARDVERENAEANSIAVKLSSSAYYGEAAGKATLR